MSDLQKQGRWTSKVQGQNFEQAMDHTALGAVLAASSDNEAAKAAAFEKARDVYAHLVLERTGLISDSVVEERTSQLGNIVAELMTGAHSAVTKALPELESMTAYQRGQTVAADFVQSMRQDLQISQSR
jgi:hypothetical protein